MAEAQPGRGAMEVQPGRKSWPSWEEGRSAHPGQDLLAQPGRTTGRPSRDTEPGAGALGSTGPGPGGRPGLSWLAQAWPGETRPGRNTSMPGWAAICRPGELLCRPKVCYTGPRRYILALASLYRPEKIYSGPTLLFKCFFNILHI
jgi:hypothetical protein